MAKKIIGGIGGLLGIGGKKKKAEAAATTEQKGPVITQLAPGTTAPNMRRRLTNAQVGTVLNTKLGGGAGKLGA